MKLNGGSVLAIIGLTSSLFLCFLACCLIRRCCPFWLSEKLGRFRDRMYQNELPNYAKSPSLFSLSMNRSTTNSGNVGAHNRNIPIVIVSDENGKRVMSGKGTLCVYEKQDLEEVL